MPDWTAAQRSKLAELLATVADRNSFWRERFAAESFDPEAVRTWADFRRLPLLSKADLVADTAQHPPYGSNLTFDRSDYIRLHQTSGTTGQPQPWLDTADSWAWFCDCWAAIFERAGVGRGDVAAFPFSFGPFIGFWAAHDGAAAAGIRTLTLGGLSTEQRLREIVRHDATVVCCTPTYGLRMAEVAAAAGLDLADSAVHTLVVAGEPGGQIPAVRERLETAFGAVVLDHWGMSDVGSLGVEPRDDRGHLVLLGDACLPEVIDPATGDDVGLGETGELVITNLGRTGMPVIRYRTGDLVTLAEPDPGTGWMRLAGGIRGRADDMLVIRGNNVFPSSVEAIIREHDHVAEFRLRVQTRRSMPHLRIEIEPQPSLAAAAVADLLGTVETACIDRLHFRAEVAAVQPGSLPRYELKSKRLVREDLGSAG